MTIKNQRLIDKVKNNEKKGDFKKVVSLNSDFVDILNSLNESKHQNE